MSDDARRAAVLEGLAKFVGPQALEAIDYIETDWSAEEWTRGAYAATFGVGGLTRFGPDLRAARGPDPLGVRGHRGRRATCTWRAARAPARRPPRRSSPALGARLAS